MPLLSTVPRRVLATVLGDGYLLQSVRDPAARQVVGRELHAHAVAGQDPDEVHPELSGNMRQHSVPVLQLDSEHRVVQRLDDRAFNLDRISLCHGRCWVPFSHGMPARAGRHTKAQDIRNDAFTATAAWSRLRQWPGLAM